jgi:hypothetical protein
MQCMTSLGLGLSARELVRHAAEFPFRAAVLNGFTALGTPVTEAVGQFRPGTGKP